MQIYNQAHGSMGRLVRSMKILLPISEAAETPLLSDSGRRRAAWDELWICLTIYFIFHKHVFFLIFIVVLVQAVIVSFMFFISFYMAYSLVNNAMKQWPSQSFLWLSLWSPGQPNVLNSGLRCLAVYV
jgi:hypothetical protein